MKVVDGLKVLAPETGTILPFPDTVHPLGMPAILEYVADALVAAAVCTQGHPVSVLVPPPIPAGIVGEPEVAAPETAEATDEPAGAAPLI